MHNECHVQSPSIAMITDLAGAAGEMANPEDIELGDMDEDEQEDAGDDLQVKQKAVPDAVFGASGLQPQADDAAADTGPLGAMKRLKKRRTS